MNMFVMLPPNEFNQTQNETIFKVGGAGKLKNHLN